MWASVVITALDGDRPDLETLEGLARLLLAARRLGWAVRVEDVGPELADLLELAGLSDLLL